MPKIDLAQEARERRESVEADGKSAAPEELVPRDLLHSVTYVQPGSNEEITGTFISTVPVDDWMTRVEKYAAKMSGGVPFEVLSPLARSRFHALARVVICTKDMDDWLLVAVHSDMNLLNAVFDGVDGHQARFLRSTLREGKTEKGRRIVEVKALGAPPRTP